VTPFAGYAEITIDDKGRLSIPAKFRAVVAPTDATASPPAMPQAYYVLPWDDALVILTERRFKALAAEPTAVIKPTMDAKTISRQRYFTLSERVEPDGAGRVTLPKELMSRMRLQGEMIIFSGGDYLQIMPLASAKKFIDELYAEGE
jgi:DNA-binding transcriptional regulator/RsmH inhibitor MraZ